MRFGANVYVEKMLFGITGHVCAESVCLKRVHGVKIRKVNNTRDANSNDFSIELNIEWPELLGIEY